MQETKLSQEYRKKAWIGHEIVENNYVSSLEFVRNTVFGVSYRVFSTRLLLQHGE